MGNGDISSIGDSQCLVDLLVDSGCPRTLNITMTTPSFSQLRTPKFSRRPGLERQELRYERREEGRFSGIADIDDLQASSIGDEQIMKLQLGCSRVIECNKRLN